MLLLLTQKQESQLLHFLKLLHHQKVKMYLELKKVIVKIFNRNCLESVIEKIVFLASDGESVNCGKHSVLIKLFQEDYTLGYHLSGALAIGLS